MTSVLSAQTTADAGQELAYNKRNRVRRGLVWDDVANKEPALRISEVVKAKVYPRPDYQALVVEGISPYIAYVVKLAYDSLSAKPRTRGAPTDAQMQQYIEETGLYMDGVLSWARDRSEGGAWLTAIRKQTEAQISAMRGTPVPLLALNDAPPKGLYRWVYPEGFAGREAGLRLIGGNEVLAALHPGINEARKAMKEMDLGWPSAAEAWQKRGMRIVEVGEVASHIDAVRVGGSPAKWVSVVHAENGKTRELEGRIFKDSEAAEMKVWVDETIKKFDGQFVVLNKLGRVEACGAAYEDALQAARDLVRKKPKDVVNERGISVEHAHREGPDRRSAGRNVSSEELMREFGFRGVNFGNWMKGEANTAERQLHLNHAYDAFHDLAQLLSIAPKAISLNGMLGIAFGAQGNGHAAAHFVPGLNEMNITRTAGAGSIAHEWAHALDHSFARAAGLDREIEPYLTVHAHRASTGGPVGRLESSIVGAIVEVVHSMTKRMITAEELVAKQGAVRERLETNVKSWLRGIRRDFESAGKGDGGFIEKFDALVERINVQNYGDGRVRAGGSYLVPVLDEMRALYKSRTGYLYSLESMKGVQSNIDAILRSENARNSDRGHETASRYVQNALALDRDKGGKPYWATVPEMFARAFDAFIQDAVQTKGWKNTYLCGLNADETTVPTGEERQALARAFDHLLSALDVRQTEVGLEICGRAKVHGANEQDELDLVARERIRA